MIIGSMENSSFSGSHFTVTFIERDFFVNSDTVLKLGVMGYGALLKDA
jgi:hypothetical protein